MCLLERCYECLGTGRTNMCNPKAVLNQGQFKNVNKSVKKVNKTSSRRSNRPVPCFLLCCVSKQTPQTEALQCPE